MGVLGKSKDKGAAAIEPNVAGPVNSGFFENIHARFRAAVAGPHSTKVGQAIYEARAYDQIIKALAAEGEMGEDYIPVRPGGIGYRGPKNIAVNAQGVGQMPVRRAWRNPYASSPSANLLNPAHNPLADLYAGGDPGEIKQIWAAVERVRRRKPDFLKAFPNQGAVAAFADARRKQQMKAAQEVTSRAGTAGEIGGFIGAMGGSIASMDPENAAGGLAGAAGKTMARTIIKRAVTGALENTAAGMVALPGQVADAEHLDSPMSADDMIRSVEETAAVGAVFGVAAPPVMHGVSSAVAAAVRPAARPIVGAIKDAVVDASIRAGTIPDRLLIDDWHKAHKPYQPGDISTPDEKAAAHVIDRDATDRETSPLHPDAAAHNERRLDAVARSLGVGLTPEVPTPAPVQKATVRDHSSKGAPSSRRPASFVEGIHRAEGTGKNPRSSAQGHGQFIDSTWLAIAPRVTDTEGMSKAQILGLRNDRSIADRATALYAQDNGRYLRSHGQEDSAGNLSLAHFLGPEGAKNVLRASPGTPVERILPAAVIRANREVLAGKSASEVIAWAHKRIGASVDMPVARADAVPEADHLDEADYANVPYERAMFRPHELETDAALMQYKSGGDERGVTNKLKDVTAWDALMSSEVLVWEAIDGRRVVVDGHQRTGLAKRLDDGTIELPALVVREADGITAAQARVLGAMRNISLDTGSLIDNARVLRDAPEGAARIKGAENRREIEGLAKLNYEAFGAVINDVIDPRIAAEVGKHSPPEAHMAMIDLLAKERIRNPVEAAHIVRQAVADGMGSATEHQMSLLGDEPQQSLYVPIARILETAAKRLRDEKRTFKVLATKSGKIEAAGNILDKTANEGKIVGSDEALAILNATAHRSGPVRDALIAAARAELSGARRADAVGEFLDALAGIDLRTAARGLEPDGPPGEPFGEAGGRDAAAASDEILAGSNGPELFDHAIAARKAAEPFSDPVGDGVKAQVDPIEHDLRMDAEQQGTMGLGLFDVADQPTFRLSDEGDPRPLADIMAESDAETAAAQALRDCLK